MSSELKPCPFCGRENIETEDGRAICMNCLVIAHERYWSDRPIEDALKEQIAKIQEDNRQLVEQMNAMANRYESLEQHCTALEEDINMWKVSGAMAINPNEEIITWHDYPDEKPERPISEKVHRLRDYMGLLVSYTIGGTQFVRYDTYHWTNDELGERETFDYTEDDIYYGGAIKVKWAYLPKGVE